jgi:hypothetical protein
MDETTYLRGYYAAAADVKDGRPAADVSAEVAVYQDGYRHGRADFTEDRDECADRQCAVWH